MAILLNLVLLAACAGGCYQQKDINVSVLSDMIEIRNDLKTCDMFSCDDVNDVITETTVF